MESIQQPHNFYIAQPVQVISGIKSEIQVGCRQINKHRFSAKVIKTPCDQLRVLHTSTKKRQQNIAWQKTCSHTSVKNENSMFPLRDIEQNQNLFNAAVLQSTKKKNQSMDNTYCLPSYQIPTVFLNYLSITNNNNGLSMSKAFTSKQN